MLRCAALGHWASGVPHTCLLAAHSCVAYSCCMCRLTVHKAGNLPKHLQNLDYPLIENENEWVVHGYQHRDYIRELGRDAQVHLRHFGRLHMLCTLHCGAILSWHQVWLCALAAKSPFELQSIIFQQEPDLNKAMTVVRPRLGHLVLSLRPVPHAFFTFLCLAGLQQLEGLHDECVGPDRGVLPVLACCICCSA